MDESTLSHSISFKHTHSNCAGPLSRSISHTHKQFVVFGGSAMAAFKSSAGLHCP